MTATGELEECVDELDGFIATLERYPHEVLAFALRAHLVARLQALRRQGAYDMARSREFLRGLLRDAIIDEG